MDLRRYAPLALALSALASACNPYHNFGGEFLAGSVDPSGFPAAFQGAGYTRGSSFGTISASGATVRSQPIGYYAFPIPINSSTAVPLTIDVGVSSPPTTLAYPVQRAFVFDPTPGGSPFPNPAKCLVPPGYLYDQRRDAYRLDEQGSIFTGLPDATGLPSGVGYLPMVAEVPVTSKSESCNDVKSAEGVVATRSDLQVQTMPPQNGAMFPTGVADGRFLAWAIVDPSADVANPDGSHNPNTGLGPQKIGWFDHLLLAYLDGGYIPTKQVAVPGMNGMPDTMVSVIVTQNLYVPLTVLDSMNKPVAGMLGGGSDILEAQRGDANYSPICHVLGFQPADPANLPTDASQITMAQITTPMGYIACLQVQ